MKNKKITNKEVVNPKIVTKVEGYSKTREQKENLTVRMKGTFAEVRSASKKKYIVTKESCTCQDHFYRGQDQYDSFGNIIKEGTVCRHRKAVADTINAMRSGVKYW